MEFTSPEGKSRYDELRRVLAGTVVGLDFDGTLSPIVPDPESARIHPDAPAVLAELAAGVDAVAVVTGRPAGQVLALGLDEVGERIGRVGHELLLFGQYGNETWTSASGRIASAPPPDGLAGLATELPDLLRAAAAEAAYVEEKGLAVAVHTRRLEDPSGSFERLLPVLAEAAARHGLAVEPGRQVIELRAPGTHKGSVVERLAADRDPRGFAFVGDDLGDVEAFHAVRDLGDRGVATLLVCSASDEENALRALADVVVDGPAGVVAFLRTLLADR